MDRASDRSHTHPANTLDRDTSDRSGSGSEEHSAAGTEEAPCYAEEPSRPRRESTASTGEESETGDVRDLAHARAESSGDAASVGKEEPSIEEMNGDPSPAETREGSQRLDVDTDLPEPSVAAEGTTWDVSGDVHDLAHAKAESSGDAASEGEEEASIEVMNGDPCPAAAHKGSTLPDEEASIEVMHGDPCPAAAHKGSKLPDVDTDLPEPSVAAEGTTCPSCHVSPTNCSAHDSESRITGVSYELPQAAPDQEQEDLGTSSMFPNLGSFSVQPTVVLAIPTFDGSDAAASSEGEATEEKLQGLASENSHRDVVEDEAKANVRQVEQKAEGKRPLHSRVGACPGSCSEAFVTLLVRRPMRMFLVMQVLVAALCGVLFKGGAINTDFESFIQASSRSSLNRDAYLHAWTISDYAPTSLSSRRLQDGPTFTHNIVHILYEQEEGQNLLEEERLWAVLQFERRLQALPRWRALCRPDLGLNDSAPSAYQDSCIPGESLVNYVWPTRLGTEARTGPFANESRNVPLSFTGDGARRMPVEVVLSALSAERSAFDMLLRFLPRGFSVPEGSARAQADLLHSHFLFSASWGPAATGASYRWGSAASSDYHNFLTETLHPALLAGDEGLRAQGIRVLYYSVPLDRLDIFHALWNDCRLALGGLLAVLFMVRLHTQSWWLSLAGLLLVLEAIPVGYVLFKHMSGLQDVSIVNCLCLFVIIGIGSDLVFVLTDGWRQSATLPSSVLRRQASGQPTRPPVESESKITQQQRMLIWRFMWVYSNSGASCVTTTLCSASSFLVNLGSVLAPLREFGLFMGLCVASALVLELAMYPLVLVALDSRCNPTQPDHQRLNAIVPAGDVDPRQAPRPSGTVQQLQSRSVVVRFLGMGWSQFIRKHQRILVGGFLTFALVCGICIPLTVNVDSGMPDVFPSSHNQVVGKLLRERFGPMANIASSGAKHKPWLCDVLSPRVEEEYENCKDLSESCGTWSSVGYCSTNSAVGNHYCRRSCGTCSYCFARWCHMKAPPRPQRTNVGSCQCFSEAPASNGSYLPLGKGRGERVHVNALIAGYPEESWLDLAPNITQFLLSLARPAEQNQRVDWNYVSQTAFRQPPLVQEHWRSGSVSSWPSFEAPTLIATTHDGSRAAPHLDTERSLRVFCYCDGITPCDATRSPRGSFHHTLSGTQPPAERRLGLQDEPKGTAAVQWRPEVASPTDGTHWLDTPARTLHGRRLAARPADVRVIYGLEVQELGPFELFVQTAQEQMWSFDPMFEPADPWAQRSMMRICEDLPTSVRANAGPEFEQGLWPKAFEEWLLEATSEQFPSRSFHERVGEFLVARPEYAHHFLRDAGGRVRAVMTKFLLEISDSAALGPALETMHAWDNYVATQNLAASIRAGRAWHTSPLWVRVEVQDAILSSTVTIILVSVGVGLLAMLLFTRNLLLAMLSMFSVVLIVVGLLFFMVTVMQWEVGAIEVVALIVFLGYMFTFNLHIAHSYIHAPQCSDDGVGGVNAKRSQRWRRARHALVSMGQSLLGSATTSVGCALFLVFCTLQFFVKFGVVILLVTVLSLVYSLLFLPALLMVCGPTHTSSVRLAAAERSPLAFEDTREQALVPPHGLGSENEGLRQRSNDSAAWRDQEEEEEEEV